MTPMEVRDGLAILRNYYADKDGQPHRLNDAQWGVYIAGLARFTPEQLHAAAMAWMLSKRWFPALSDLLGVLEPHADAATQAHLAWTEVERAIRRHGAYQGVTFMDSAIGETVRQVFGSWAHACGYDWDSPGWAIKRQTFLAVFPTLQARTSGEPVTLKGMDRHALPAIVGHVDGLPEPSRAAQLSDGLSHHESVTALALVASRAAKKVTK